jgi:hypothetical protein
MKISTYDKLVWEAFILIILFFIYGVLIGILFETKSTTNTLLAFSAILIPAFTYSFRKYFDNITSRYLALKGEYDVSLMLNEMWPPVRSIHDLVIDENIGEIDHVVVAKNGIWVIDSKCVNGDISVKNGVLEEDGRLFPKDVLQRSYLKAVALRDSLYSRGVTEAPVRPAIIFSGRYSLSKYWFDPINRVYVVNSSNLQKLVTNSRLDDCLSPAEIEKIVNYFNRFKKSKKG